MKRFLAWLLDYRCKECDRLYKAMSEQFAEHANRMYGLETSLSEMEKAHTAEIAELRERLDLPQKRKSSGRTFQQLRAVAEAGERAKRES